MQYRPNYYPERSADIRPESLHHKLTHRAMVHWDGHKHSYLHRTVAVICQLAT